jgi:hypothetical protein
VSQPLAVRIAIVVSANTNVLIITNGGEFGRPDHGFLVTNTNSGGGIVIDGTNIKVRGNQIQVAAGSAGLVFPLGSIVYPCIMRFFPAAPRPWRITRGWWKVERSNL